jgi:hypothetical protein
VILYPKITPRNEESTHPVLSGGPFASGELSFVSERSGCESIPTTDNPRGKVISPDVMVAVGGRDTDRLADRIHQLPSAAHEASYPASRCVG